MAIKFDSKTPARGDGVSIFTFLSHLDPAARDRYFTALNQYLANLPKSDSD